MEAVQSITTTKRKQKMRITSRTFNKATGSIGNIAVAGRSIRTTKNKNPRQKAQKPAAAATSKS